METYWIVLIIAAIVLAVIGYYVMKPAPPHPNAGAEMAAYQDATKASATANWFPWPTKASGRLTKIDKLTDFNRSHNAYEATHCRINQRDVEEAKLPCGVDGVVQRCPSYAKPTVIGEQTWIPAVTYGTIHDPRWQRICEWNPKIMGNCGREVDLTKSFKGSDLEPATGLDNGGHLLRQAYTSVFSQ